MTSATRGSRFARRVLATLGVLLAISCAETTRIVSRPSGAQVKIDGRLAGVTPLTFTVPRSEWPHTFSCQVTQDGFVPETRLLTPQIGGGRITAGIMTVGVALLFKSPYVFASDQYDFDLSYASGASSSDPSQASR
jgi:hypothetical protein